MGVKVIEATADLVRLSVPLAPNINHRKTIFGGSASASATLSAWCLLWIRLRNHCSKPELVIQANTMAYTKPIRSDFTSSTLPIDDREWRKFLAGIERKGRGRVHVKSILEFDGQICGEFAGTFVALVD